MNRIQSVLVVLLVAFAPSMAWVGGGSAVSGRVAGFRINGVSGSNAQLWFKIEGDNNYYILQVARSGVTEAVRIEIRNSERALLLHAYATGEKISFQRSATSVSGQPTVFDVENLTLGPVQ